MPEAGTHFDDNDFSDNLRGLSRVLDRQRLKDLREAAMREDWHAVGDAYLELLEGAEDPRDRFDIEALKAEVRLRDPARIVMVVDQMLGVDNG